MRQKLTKIIIIILGLLLVAYLILAVLAQPAANKPFFAQDDFMVIAHQGGEELRPSNTMIAYQHAVDLGVDVLEMDLHSTGDGVLVLMHDATVDRTTDGSGAIKEMNLAEIKRLDAGHYWTADDGATYPYRGQGITVPTLEEVFTAFPDMLMNIEIKQQEPSIVEAFCQQLIEYDMGDKVLIPSFHPETMTEFREKCPGVATAMAEPEIRLFYGLNLAFLSRLFSPSGEAFQVPEYSGDTHVVTERFVRGAQRRNIAVHVWTVDDQTDMARFIEMGVDGIITDRPDLLLALLGRN
jgi:glycerophosphoryl diester phosphodiesterase